VKPGRLALVLIGPLLPLLAGCGSSSSPPYAVSCTARPFLAHRVLATVKVTNNSSQAGNPILYGPVFSNLTLVLPPVLKPVMVHVALSSGQTTYPGFVVPKLAASHSTQLIMRFTPPSQPEPIVVTDTASVQATGSDALSNPDCMVKG
jgi:hypothetical protein